MLFRSLETYRSLFREFCDVFAWSYEEVPGIDTSIVEHTINLYPDVKLVHQHLRPVYPKKATTIKTHVEKILCAGFIYPVPLTEWVSNIVPVMKNKEPSKCVSIIKMTILLVQKTTILLPLSTRLLTNVPTVKYFRSWMDFPATIKSISS